MRLVTFEEGGDARLGALAGSHILDLNHAGSRLGLDIPASMQALIDAGPAAWDKARAAIDKCPDESVLAGVTRLLSPLPRPVRMRDASLFLEHMAAGLQKLGKVMTPQFYDQVIYYNADHIHVCGTGDDIVWPRNSQWMDYELEWACVVGKTGANIAPAQARDYIFGFTIFNDWSARDLQFPFMEGNLGPGGGKDFATTLGPCIATYDEFDDPYQLQMTAHVNGELWSSGSTSTMHHRFEDAIVDLSKDRSITAGEVIGSGTVLDGCGFELDRQLKHGDCVRLEVEGIGFIENRVVTASGK